jgi:hypothetical protein
MLSASGDSSLLSLWYLRPRATQRTFCDIWMDCIIACLNGTSITSTSQHGRYGVAVNVGLSRSRSCPFLKAARPPLRRPARHGRLRTLVSAWDTEPGANTFPCEPMQRSPAIYGRDPCLSTATVGTHGGETMLPRLQATFCLVSPG